MIAVLPEKVAVVRDLRFDEAAPMPYPIRRIGSAERDIQPDQPREPKP